MPLYGEGTGDILLHLSNAGTGFTCTLHHEDHLGYTVVDLMCRTGGVAVLALKECCRIEGELLCDADLLTDSEEAFHRVVDLDLQKVRKITDR